MAAARLDAACLDAVEVARAAATQEAPAGHVGDWLHAEADADRVATHYFACLAPAYLGWRWAVTVARASRGRTVTVDEVVLLPGDGALLAPEWVPWQQRVAAGDLGVGDLLPPEPGDPRIEPGYTGSDALDPADAPDGDGPLRPEQWELGLGREFVLSPWGRDDATTRWSEGAYGPDSAMAKAAPATCADCGFMIPVGGSVGQQFGLCANEMAPADGRAVDLRYGCGAHTATPPVDGAGVTVHTALLELGD